MKMLAVFLVFGFVSSSVLADEQKTGAFIHYVFPGGGQIGTKFDVKIGGLNLGGAETVRFSGEGVSGKISKVESKVEGKKKKGKKKKKKVKKSEDLDITDVVHVTITIGKDAELGLHDLRVVTSKGVSNRFRFMVGQIREMIEVEPNSRRKDAMKLGVLPVVVNGRVDRGDSDIFRFSGKAGQTMVCDGGIRSLIPFIADAVPGWFQGCLSLYDSKGRELKFVDDFRFNPDPLLIYEIKKDGEYYLEIRDAIYRGREDFVYRLRVGELPYITHIFPIGGRQGSSTDVKLYGANLGVKQKQVVLKADASGVEYVNVSSGGIVSNSVPFGVGGLGEVVEDEAKNSDSKAMAVSVPVIINGRIDKAGDVDQYSFGAKAKQKLAIEVLARDLGSPLDSVITLVDSKGKVLKQADDSKGKNIGIMTHRADAKMEYKFRSAGDYTVKIRDVQGHGGQEYGYRLSIAEPEPDFVLYAVPDNPVVGQGGTTEMSVHAVRRGGFNGKIDLEVKGLGEGFVVSRAFVPAKQDVGRFTISAGEDVGKGIYSPVIMGRGEIGGEERVHKAIAAEELMQAFIYEHLVPTADQLLTVGDPVGFTISHEHLGEAVKIPLEGEVKIKVKAHRRGEGKNQISIVGVKPPKGIVVRRSVIAKGEDEGVVTIILRRKFTVGYTVNIILEGSMKVGKKKRVSVVPAIGIVVVEKAQNGAGSDVE